MNEPQPDYVLHSVDLGIHVSPKGGTVDFHFDNVPLRAVPALFHYLGSEEGLEQLFAHVKAASVLHRRN